MAQNFNRRCDRCKTPLAGRRGHGFVNEQGTSIRCGRKDECERQARRLAGIRVPLEETE